MLGFTRTSLLFAKLLQDIIFYANLGKVWHWTNEIHMMKLLGKLNFLVFASGLWWKVFFFWLKHFIFIPVWFIEASVIPSAPTVPDKSRAMLDWKDRGAIFQMDLFLKIYYDIIMFSP